jgi:Cysteine-rich secretory protein family
MTHRAITLLCAILCLGAAPPSVTDRLLSAHNAARRDVGVSPLRWNVSLARDAQLWAARLAKSGAFEHAPQKDQGENLWAGTRARYSPEEMVDAWVDEKRDFKPGRFPNVTKAGDVQDVGHYTQLIWHRTTDVGCAIATGIEDDVLVCRYSPPGNWEGQDPLAGPALKKAPPPVSKKRRRGG